jgi:hypothetical protein
VPDEPVPDDAAGLHAANARLREVLGAKDTEIGMLQAGLDAAREREPRLELRLAELERRLGMDSSDSGTPSSKERIGAKEARRARQESERDRRKDRKPGGQPGHPGKGLARDPEPGERKEAPPPTECRGCRAGLDGAAAGVGEHLLEHQPRLFQSPGMGERLDVPERTRREGAFRAAHPVRAGPRVVPVDQRIGHQAGRECVQGG